jgi:AcrR family transcriptional regulator
VLIYRHFDSKDQLYRAVLDQTRKLLAEATGAPDQLGPSSLQALVRVAQEHPDEFRLFFRHAGREPDFRAHADELRAAMTTTTLPYLHALLPNDRLRAWAAELVPVVAIEAILAWLDAGCPRPERAADTIGAVIGNIIDSISQVDRTDDS